MPKTKSKFDLEGLLEPQSLSIKIQVEMVLSDWCRIAKRKKNYTLSDAYTACQNFLTKRPEPHGAGNHPIDFNPEVEGLINQVEQAYDNDEISFADIKEFAESLEADVQLGLEAQMAAEDKPKSRRR